MSAEPVLKRVRRREPLLPRDVNALTQFDQLPILESLLPHLTMDDVILVRTSHQSLDGWGKTPSGTLFPWVKLDKLQTDLMLKQHWFYGGHYWGDNIHTVYIEKIHWDKVDGESRYIFANARNVTLSRISRLFDVSSFASVHTLNLHYLNNIDDVSALGNVHTLFLDNLLLVTDVSALGTVHTLGLRLMAGATDVSALGNVHTLTVQLANMDNMTNIRALRNVHDLSIVDTEGLIGATWLGGVHTLHLEGVGLNELASLGSVRELTLNWPIWINHNNIVDISMLNTVHTLELHGHLDVTDVSSLGRGTVQDLTLDKMRNVHDISGLGSIPILHLIDMQIRYDDVMPLLRGLTMKNTTFTQKGGNRGWGPPYIPPWRLRQLSYA